MKRITFFSAVMTVMMISSGMNTYAQNRERGGHSMDNARGGRTEMSASRHEGQRSDARGMEVRPENRYRSERAGGHFDSNGYLPGYEGRVRYVDGRYGYFRDNRWYWYDTFFEPEYYYGRPVAHFRPHILGPVGRGIVGGAVAGAVIGSIISGLAR